MEEKSRAQHIYELSKELLDDIELSRTSADSLLLKTTRLARYVGSDEVKKWLQFELSGYNNSNPVSLRYMSKTGRWTNFKEKKGYWGPLAQIQSMIDAQKLKLQSMSIPNTSGQWAHVATNNTISSMNTASNVISTLSGITTRVLALIHQFVSDVYYEKTFDKLSESVFESYKNGTDLLIAKYSSDVIQQIPSVMDRLSEGDPEATSQALTTCRRIIDSFANAIFPPSDEMFEIDGNQISLKADKTLNRINAYIHQNCQSGSRRKRFRQNLGNLYDRVSTGVHSEVDVNEARALFLNTYLIIGEILNLTKN
ncbi:AbiTii domain-containing protein [Bacillus sp. T33-2]|uniref:AbiTii domain-containing protein n=1 Tax=Bacillus sp. T33-2 TaxID=2054168 RepID=UPI000C78BF93|nr:hypothetical protein [Bacillus sp. T33-2]PLR93207.1 hypothetical protein CVD19_19580 [Bacillus sp. T33-2]